MIDKYHHPDIQSLKVECDFSIIIQYIMQNKDLIEVDYATFSREQLIEIIISLKEQNACMKEEKERLINHYRDYDLKRKKYYKTSMQELGELRSFVEEMDKENVYTTVKNLKKQVGKLNELLQYSRISQADKDDYDKIKSVILQESLKKQICHLKENIKKLREDKNILLIKLCQKEKPE